MFSAIASNFQSPQSEPTEAAPAVTTTAITPPDDATPGPSPDAPPPAAAAALRKSYTGKSAPLVNVFLGHVAGGRESGAAGGGAVHPSMADVAVAAMRHLWIPPKSGIPWSEDLSAITYLPSTKFGAPLTPEAADGKSPYEICSISEDKTKKLYADLASRVAMVGHNGRQLTRIFPDGIRQDSSNLDPSAAWSMGCHMVCLNYQVTP